MKEIKTTTIYSEAKIKQFLKIYFFDRIKSIRIILNILIILLIVYFFVNLDNNTTLDYIATFIAVFGLLEVNTNIVPNLNYNRLKKKKDNIIDMEIQYIFKKNNFEINSDKTEYIDYDKLYKIINTKNAYYLYISRDRAFIVDKEVISKENIEILDKKFKDKVKNYKEDKNV